MTKVLGDDIGGRADRHFQVHRDNFIAQVSKRAYSAVPLGYFTYRVTDHLVDLTFVAI